MTDPLQYLEECRAETEVVLRAFLDLKAEAPRLKEAVEYSLFAGGKRIRPGLAMAGAEAVGGKRSDALPLACALEMIHTYSLIHDDLPAMDNDDLRRGRPTNHKVYGDALAILAGDALLTHAFWCLSDPDWRVPADRKVRIIRYISEGAGLNGMVGGQALDLQQTGKDFTEASLERIHRNKTGALLGASVLAGACAGGATEGDLVRLEHFGRAIGLAFQIADDLLDVTATSEQLGKNAQRDLENHKATYPALLGVEASRKKAQRLLAEALNQLAPFGARGEPLASLARFIVDRTS